MMVNPEFYKLDLMCKTERRREMDMAERFMLQSPNPTDTLSAPSETGEDGPRDARQPPTGPPELQGEDCR